MHIINSQRGLKRYAESQDSSGRVILRGGTRDSPLCLRFPVPEKRLLAEPGACLRLEAPADVIVCEGAWIDVCTNAHVELEGSGLARLHGHSDVILKRHMAGIALDCSSAVLFGLSEMEACGHARIKARGHSAVVARGASRVELYQHSMCCKCSSKARVVHSSPLALLLLSEEEYMRQIEARRRMIWGGRA